MLAGKGKRMGIHLFVEATNGENVWLFVIYRSDSRPHHHAKALSPGDRIRVEITQAKSGNPFVNSLEKLD